MELPKFGPGDLCFRDFSKPWYNDRAMGMCLNAIESLIGEEQTDFFGNPGKFNFSQRCVEIGAKFNIFAPRVCMLHEASIELQNLISALESKGVFTHHQLEARYNSLRK